MQTDKAVLSRNMALALVITAVVQSALLLALHKVLVHGFWPATDPRWLHAAYTVFVGTPAFLYLGLREWNDRVNVLAVGAMALILFWLGWHAGWVAIPYASGDYGYRQSSMTAQLVCVAAVMVFVAAFLFRGWREGGHWRRPPALFLSVSWDNALTLGFLKLYLIAFWLLLALWAALFKLINIEFFVDLFTAAEFIYPVTGLAGGLGLVIIRQRMEFISSVRYMCETLIRALLPLVVVTLLCFLAALPFTGLAPLWETGFGTFLLLLISAVILFAFNADFGGGRSLAYPRALAWLIRAGVSVVPVSLALAGWGLWLRVEQYGWTLSRYWALFIILVLAAFSLAYVYNILVAAARKQKLAYRQIECANASLGIALLLALLLVNTGLFDFRKLAVSAQLDRLASGDVAQESFDIHYLAFRLGHYGHRELINLRDVVEEEAPAFAARINAVLNPASRGKASDSDLLPEGEQALRDQFLIMEGVDVPADLLRALLEDGTTRSHCLESEPRCRLVTLPVYDDAVWVLAKTLNTSLRYSRLAAHDPDGDGWLNVGYLAHPQCPARWSTDGNQESSGEEGLEIVELVTEPAPFLRIGRCAYQLIFFLDARPLSSKH
ncbi:MAG: DUF4153 domain-containing protein [Alcanivorax sp.]|nr:DUF4153 domain-containing protein [Alcanivorax sp.]